jgi:hypothetical protein
MLYTFLKITQDILQVKYLNSVFYMELLQIQQDGVFFLLLSYKVKDELTFENHDPVSEIFLCKTCSLYQGQKDKVM